MQIETIPNPLNDKGVMKDIAERVDEMLKWQGGHRNINEHIKELVTEAAKWGMSTGFRMGWRVYEFTNGRQ